MPSLNAEVVRRLCAVEGEWDAVVPVNADGYLEPLHALYARSALGEIQTIMDQGDKSILLLFDRIRTRRVGWDEISAIEGAGASFRNVNTPEEYEEINLK
jgi:molybdopterin-guanine dinucleotide biosynthesis protein A